MQEDVDLQVLVGTMLLPQTADDTEELALDLDRNRPGFFTMPRPTQCGQAVYIDVVFDSVWRWRVIWSTPSWEIGRIWCLARSPSIASRKVS